MIKTYAELRADIKSGNVNGAYILFGEEDYTKGHCVKEIRNAVLPGGDITDINYIRLDSDNFSAAALASACETLPCFAEKKLIEVYETDFRAMKEKELSGIIEILKKLEFYDYNTVVFFTRSFEIDAGTYRKKQFVPSKCLKALCDAAQAVLFEYEQPGKLAVWLAKHFSSEGIEAMPDECRLVIELCGRDMFTLSHEAEKLCAYISSCGRNKLLEGDIYSCVIPNKEYDVFAFANSILAGNIDEAYAILEKKKEQKEKPEFILSGIQSAFYNMCRIKAYVEDGASLSDIAGAMKMHEYTVSLYMRAVQNKSRRKLSKLLARCTEADLKMKSTALDTDLILSKLVASTVGL